MHDVALRMRLDSVGDKVRPVDSMQVGYHAPMSMYSSSIGPGVMVVPNKYHWLSEDAIVFFQQNQRVVR
jgi:hypothetical protein